MRFVLKLGTALLTKEDGTLHSSLLRSVISECAAIKKRGHEVVIVSSGAVGAGRSELRVEREKRGIPFRQALAAVGQGILMSAYHDGFAKYDIRVAQALLTNYDFSNRENFLNTKNVIGLLLKHGVVPIVNENDVTTIAELKFGDNDVLSAKTAAMVSADYLVILTDVDGLFSGDPKKNPRAELLHAVGRIDETIRGFATGARSSRSLGGMKTKLDAAEYATSVGIPMFIVNGNRKGILRSIVEFCETHTPRGEEIVRDDFFAAQNLGTFFSTRLPRVESQKKWLTPKLQKGSWVLVDEGAARALREKGKSLLASGVSGLGGNFLRGDVVTVRSVGGEIAYGQVNYSAADLEKIKKRRSDEIEKILGYSFEEEVIHRDRMVVL